MEEAIRGMLLDPVVARRVMRRRIEHPAVRYRAGKLAGFGTDVWYSDPPEWKNPLFDAPNTLFAPHIGAGTRENMLRIGEIVHGIIDSYVGKKA